jgi:Tfp pilus assembly protein PilN
MIRINLLPQRKARRHAEPGQRDVALGALALIAAGLATFLLLHQPKAAERDRLQASNDAFAEELARRKAKIRSLPQLRAAVAAAEQRGEAIEALLAARAVPAHMLHELGELLTPGRLPTMTKDIARRVGDPRDDAYRFRDDWDPKHVWITEIVEKKGELKITGGAESDADVGQLMKRMQASVYFEGITPTLGQKVTDKATGLTYYQFTITGKVVY